MLPAPGSITASPGRATWRPASTDMRHREPDIPEAGHEMLLGE